MFLGRQAAEIVCSLGAAIAGAAALAFIAFGPSYSTASTSIGADGTVTERSGTASRLEVGLSPLAALVMLSTALALLGVAIGGLRDARGESGGRGLLYLSAFALLVVMVMSAASIGSLLLPAGLLAATGSLISFRRQDSA